jgi:hypothetical protein
MESYMLLSFIWLVTSLAIRLLVIRFGFVSFLKSRAKVFLGIRRSRERPECKLRDERQPPVGDLK